LVVLKWIRSRRPKQEEPAGEHCFECRTLLPDGAEERRASGAVLLDRVGWFCALRCEQRYRFRFRLQPSRPPSPDSSPVAPAPTPSSTVQVVHAVSSPEELLAAIRERRRRALRSA